MLNNYFSSAKPFPFGEEQKSRFRQLSLCGESEVFVKTLELIEKLALHQATVLIQGETGTGKENAARAIHYLGARGACPFIPINCATIPDELLESELFGHEKGAFTDARQAKEGLVAIANGGTLFLDEVDNLSPKAQAALLRFLQTQEYRPVGAKKILRANVRIIAATNADLKQLIQGGQFREDLYFRLDVLALVMPSLRERLDDIPSIADSMLQRFSQEYQMPIKLLSRQGLLYLQQKRWPGNVRELENALLRAFLLSSGECLEFSQCSEYSESQVEDALELTQVNEPSTTSLLNSLRKFQDAKGEAIALFEKKYLSELMAISHGNVTVAAKIAGKERRALGKLLQKYHINKAHYRSELSL